VEGARIAEEQTMRRKPLPKRAGSSSNKLTIEACSTRQGMEETGGSHIMKKQTKLRALLIEEAGYGR
jgi:hypothetical protein